MYRDRILWVDSFVETHNRMPTIEEVVAELEVGESSSQVVLANYQSLDFPICFFPFSLSLSI